MCVFLSVLVRLMMKMPVLSYKIETLANVGGYVGKPLMLQMWKLYFISILTDCIKWKNKFRHQWRGKMNLSILKTLESEWIKICCLSKPTAEILISPLTSISWSFEDFTQCRLRSLCVLQENMDAVSTEWCLMFEDLSTCEWATYK